MAFRMSLATRPTSASRMSLVPSSPSLSTSISSPSLSLAQTSHFTLLGVASTRSGRSRGCRAALSVSRLELRGELSQRGERKGTARRVSWHDANRGRGSPVTRQWGGAPVRVPDPESQARRRLYRTQDRNFLSIKGMERVADPHGGWDSARGIRIQLRSSQLASPSCAGA